ncbi:hypothetical protein QF91_004407 [Salmonella enterica subsp. salamae]|nr:hypothetical protein [Salmonella enterica subsp. salamae]
MMEVTFIFKVMSFYLFYFNGLSFLCCSEAGCGSGVCAFLKEKQNLAAYYDYYH